jgi:hypothetical protein
VDKVEKMFKWVWNNKEWLFSGVGLVAIYGLISLLRARSSRRSKTVDNSRTVSKTKTQDVKTVEPVLSKPTEQVTLSSLRKLTPDSIYKTIEDAPLLIRSDIAKHYRGIQVQWEGPLLDISMREGMLHLQVQFYRSVFFDVDPKNYPGIGLMRSGDIIKFEGTIKEVDTLWIRLIDVKILP